MIEQEKIDHIKATVDMKALAEARCIKLKKNGRGYFGLCPFHDDHNPSLSVNPKTNLWQCFGCGAAGDVIRFIELFDQVDFKEAVNRLSGNGHTTRKKADKQKSLTQTAANPEPRPPQVLTAEQLKLFNRVIDFYHTAFGEDNRARIYLEGRGLKDTSLHEAYKTGFANGTLLNVLPQNGGITEQLQALGILNDKGHEFFYGCVVFPVFDQNGDPCGLYGRRLESMGTGADHLYLPGQRRGVFNWQAAKAHKELILTESIIDALTLINAGISNVIPCYGTNGLTDDHLRLFKEQQTETVLICFDADASGQTAAQAAAATLQAENISSQVVELPEDRDINDFFLLTADPVKAFVALLPQSPAASENPPASTESLTQTDTGFVLVRDGRTYDVRGLVKKETRLKATVKAVKGQGAGRRVWPDTVDFYSARSRAALARGLRDLFDADEPTIDNDIQRLLALAENNHPLKADDAPDQEMTEAEKTEALRFLQNPDMFGEILADIETLGYTGEAMNKLLCYVAAVSRKTEHPLSVMIQSRSAAGKSFLQDTILSLMPEEDKTKYTRLTDQALFYTGRHSLKHKILAIEELDGMNGAIYAIRSIQSAKQVAIAYTGKDAATGEQKTLENIVEGPVMVFITTTQVDIDGETASRFVFISVDESEAMTKKILDKQRQSHTMTGMVNKLQADAIIKKHNNANRLLKPLHVFNPYAELLTFTSKSLRARRDHTKYLNLISAVAFLFQHQRQPRTMTVAGQTLKYINVTLADIEQANRIADEVLGRSLDELPPPSRALLGLIREMCQQHTADKSELEEYHFTRKDIREYSGWSDFQVKTHIRQLEELEYLYAVAGKKGKEYVYELIVTEPKDTPFLPGLIDINRLKKQAKAAGITDDPPNLEG